MGMRSSLEHLVFRNTYFRSLGPLPCGLLISLVVLSLRGREDICETGEHVFCTKQI